MMILIPFPFGFFAPPPLMGESQDGDENPGFDMLWYVALLIGHNKLRSYILSYL